MLIIEYFAFGLAALWLVISAAVQFRKPWARQIRRYDRLRLLPSFQFFAPNTVKSDIHLLYRDITRRGLTGRWIELISPDAPRFWHSFWNPGKRPEKGIIDIAVALKRVEQEGKIRAESTYPYFLVLRYVMLQPKTVDVAFREFIFMQKEGHKMPCGTFMMFRSARHAIW